MLLKRHYNWDAPREDWESQERRCEECGQNGSVISHDGNSIVKCPACKGMKKVVVDVPPVAYVELKHTGHTPQQNFSPKMIARCSREGWLRLSGGKINIDAMDFSDGSLTGNPVTLSYRIDKTPGRYCCHCGDKLPDDNTGELSRMHVAMEHAGEVSPDPTCQAGYAKVNAYLCTLDADQHTRYSVQRTPEGHLMQGGKQFKGGKVIDG